MKVAYLDRDGVINVKPKKHQYVTNWEMFEFIPNIFMFLKKLLEDNFKLIIITNQQGIGKGLFSIEDLNVIHNKMLSVLKSNQINIEKIYFCPHLISENCNCRKPKTGMLLDSLRDFPNIDISKSILIGDSKSDLIAGNNFGVKSYYIDDYDKII